MKIVQQIKKLIIRKQPQLYKLIIAITIKEISQRKIILELYRNKMIVVILYRINQIMFNNQISKLILILLKKLILQFPQNSLNM